MAKSKDQDLLEELMDDSSLNEGEESSSGGSSIYKPVEAVATEKKKKEVWPIVLIAIAVLAAAAAVIYFFFPGLIPFSSSGSGEKAYVMSVRDISSTPLSGQGSNRYSGVVEPQETREINLDTSKELGEIFVEVGDVVNAGDQLFSYDVDSMRMSLSELNLKVESLNSQITDKNNEIKSYEADRASDPARYDIMIQQCRNEIQSYNYEIKKTRLEIDSLKMSIENSIVKSPLTGTVKTINDPNNPSSTSQDSSAFMTIMSAGDYLIKATVNELNISQLYVGMPMTIRSRVDESITWTGTINKIDTSSPVQDNQNMYYYDMGGDSGQSSSKYYFYVSPDSSSGIILGQHVTVETAEESPVSVRGFLLGSYYINDANTSHPWVWADVNGKLKKVEIKLGIYNPSTDEYDIVSGLTLDDYIAFPDESLKEGMKTTTEYIEPSYDDMMMNEGYYDDGVENGIKAEEYPEAEAPVITGELIEGEPSEASQP